MLDQIQTKYLLLLIEMVTTKAAEIVTFRQEDTTPGQNKDWVIKQQVDPDIQAVKRYVEQPVPYWPLAEDTLSRYR